MNVETSPGGVMGDIDTMYLTQQRDTFTSGLAREIGAHAYMVWHAIKSHADFATGEAWPGVRRLMEQTGMASHTVQEAIQALRSAHLLRESRRVGRSIVYIPRERLDVRIGSRVICIVVVDYVPNAMRERLAKLRSAAAGDLSDADVWADVEILPGPGFMYDAQRQAFVASLRADEVPLTPLPSVDAAALLPNLLTPDAARARLNETARALKPAKRVPKN